MSFKVFAGNMYCGRLTVTTFGVHIFRNRDNVLSECERIYNYKQLKLERI